MGAITVLASASTQTALRDDEAGADRVPEAQGLAPIQYRDPGRYTIICEHGRGGLGRVSRARDRELGRDVAIKELINGKGPGEVRFLREALITARLEHPGIVPIHEAGRWPDGTPFYSMKLVAGRSLKELIAACSSIDERLRLLDHVIAVADAVAYAHGRRIIHRDLKPGNVIVGEFGETVVIDWGLAKDLSGAEDKRLGEGPYRVSHIDDFTTTGAVLGTPAYMPPEQERGDPVDERADVFAIGAMLWELCAVQRVPPSDPRQRNRLLRRTGIDPDLAAIIGKALNPDRSLRYNTAVELAADLSAFRAGIRISARRYTMLAVLRHWARRHRALAVAIVVGLVAVAASSISYVRNITFERDRTDAALVTADEQRAEAVRARDALALRHAQVLLHIDPTAATELLATYHGSDTATLEQIRARAKALGVSRTITVPHTSRILSAQALPDGSLLTIGDHTIVKTSLAGKSVTIANNATPHRESSYAASRRLLAYICDSTQICILDAISGRAHKIAVDVAISAPVSVSLSPDGKLLAACSDDGKFAIWDLLDIANPFLRHQSTVDAGPTVRFVDDQRYVVVSSSRVRLFLIDRLFVPRPGRAMLAADPSDLDVKRDGTMVAVASLSGALQVWNLYTGVSHDVSLCAGAMTSVRFLSHDVRVAYACQDGNAGIWNVDAGRSVLSTHLEGGAAVVEVSDDDRYLIIGGNNGSITIHDFRTGLYSSYLGHTAWVSQIVPPSPNFPYLASGDRSGILRVWDLPRDNVRVAIHSTSRLISAVLVSSDGPVVATGISSALRWASFDGQAGALSDHHAGHMAIAISPDMASFSMYMGDSTIEQWSLKGQPSRRLVKTDHEEVTSLRYLSDGESFLSGGRDGRIVLWSPQGAHHEIAKLSESVESIRLLGSDEIFVVRGVGGSFKKIDHGVVSIVAPEVMSVARYVASSDGRWLAAVTQHDQLHVYDTRTWLDMVYSEPLSKLSDLVFSSTGEQLAVSVESGVYLFDVLNGLRLVRKFDIRVDSLAYSSDRRWLALAGVDGVLWFYSLKDGRWICLNTGSVNIFYGQFAPDAKHFVATDSGGRALLVDMSHVD